MYTRSKTDFSNVKEKDFFLKFQNTGIKSRKSTKKKKKCILLFDIESLKFKDLSLATHPEDFRDDSNAWVPHQISWNISKYDRDSNTLITLKHRNYYISDIWVDPRYTSQINKIYKDSLSKHLKNIKKCKFPMRNAFEVINKILKDFKTYNVTDICAYNIFEDFKALKNLKDYFCVPHDIDENIFDTKYVNPFRDPSLKYFDLMHNTSLFYMDYFIEEGFKDEKIFRNAKTQRIKLTGRNNGKSIYSAEYVLDKFFNEKQTHVANEDVILEQKLLDKIISDFGINKLEYNVMYTGKLYNHYLKKINLDYSQQVKTAYLYGKKSSRPSQNLNEIDVQSKEDNSKDKDDNSLPQKIGKSSMFSKKNIINIDESSIINESSIND